MSYVKRVGDRKCVETYPKVGPSLLLYLVYMLSAPLEKRSLSDFGWSGLNSLGNFESKHEKLKYSLQDSQ